MRALAVVAGLITALGMAVVIVWGVDQNKQDPWWGAWGQWVGAVGSIAAAAVAVAIAYLGWKKSDEQSAKQEHRLQELTEQDQASKVAVWLVDGRPMNLVVMYSNGSGLPVHDFQVAVQLTSLERETKFTKEDLRIDTEFRSLGPTNAPELVESFNEKIDRRIDEILTELHGAEPFHPDTRQEAISDFVQLTSHARIIAAFRDNANRYWVRFPSGRLRQVSEQMGTTFATLFGMEENLETFTRYELLLESRPSTKNKPSPQQGE
ncbi:hypothetical protein [Amycolatopsis sp. cmx-8-4]|uniref:hypothetical protein n=1 Tax=Amycolatopsis sp. cmx-8-4 TaxID=2790947 RepID=UPI00397C2FCE